MVVEGLRGLALAMWAFLLRYFRYINTLGFIPYGPHFVILSQIVSETFSSTCGFFPQGFPRKSCVFLYFRISLLCH